MGERNNGLTRARHSRAGRLVGLVLACAAAGAIVVPAASGSTQSDVDALAGYNAWRQAMGMAAVGWSDRDVVGCINHLRWMDLNPNARDPHVEASGEPGYTPEGAVAGRRSVLNATADWSRDATPFSWIAPMHDLKLMNWWDTLMTRGQLNGRECANTFWDTAHPTAVTPGAVAYTFPFDSQTNVPYAVATDREWPHYPTYHVGLPEGPPGGPALLLRTNVTGRCPTPGTSASISLTGPDGAPVASRFVGPNSPKDEFGRGTDPNSFVGVPEGPLQPTTTYAWHIDLVQEAAECPNPTGAGFAVQEAWAIHRTVTFTTGDRTLGLPTQDPNKPNPNPYPDPVPTADRDGDGVPDTKDLCPAASGPWPGGCPTTQPRTQPPPPQPRWSFHLDTTARRQKARTVLRSGLKVSGVATTSGSIRVSLYRAKKKVGAGRIIVRRAGAFATSVKLTAAAKRLLKKGALKIRVVGIGGAGGRDALTVTLTGTRR